ncbi:hypothetical protein HF086_015236 [Spodoptera exigua]|uniref:Uncharacterized protein n=1 Tax=Spodoptera exigua TaxID=7107 RepID=A0A922M8M6_SPOEX|nr:hypothetical protein HF086_015236 [Spodoptera exigua]
MEMDDAEASSVQYPTYEPNINLEDQTVEVPLPVIPLPLVAPSPLVSDAKSPQSSPTKTSSLRSATPLTQSAPISPLPTTATQSATPTNASIINELEPRESKQKAPEIYTNKLELDQNDSKESDLNENIGFFASGSNDQTKTPTKKEPSLIEQPAKRSLLSPKTMSKGKSPRTQSLAQSSSESKCITEKFKDLKDTVQNLANDKVDCKPNKLTTNIDKIACMSKALTNEANALRQSIKCLSKDIERTKQELCYCPKDEDVNFPYHLFLIEIIVNKIHMKCECFEIDHNNLVISATFLGKPPITLYDSSFGKIENFSKLNVGKSIMFAMTYDKICNIKEFEIVLLLTKQPPCSTCVTRIAETHMDYTCEFNQLREELCKKWSMEQPQDNILCTTSTPLSKNMYYLSCCDGENRDSIGVIEVTVRMSFLGKEITTAFCASPKPQGTSFLLKEDHGMTMYSCHKVEMDDQGKILLDEGVMAKKATTCSSDLYKRSESPQSQITTISRGYYDPVPLSYYENDHAQKYDEIYTKMNVNELRIRVPKSSKVERMGKYDKIQELCSCDSTAYNTGEQIQFELPKDAAYPETTYTSNLKYKVKGPEKPPDRKDRKIINVTPTSCPVPVNMEKVLHPQKDVFILKIGKKLETKDKKTDLEIELITPKGPCDDKPLESNNIAQQCSGSQIAQKNVKQPKGKKKKAKGVKGKKAKKELNTFTKTTKFSILAGLGEFRIRDLNDEINKLMREKRHWEVQIKSLGGPDHARVGPKMLDQDGKEVPGVRELFEQEPPPPPRRTRADLMRDVDADYYGYRDDDDAIARAVAEWKRNKEENKDQDLPEEENIYPEDPDDKRIEEEDENGEPVRQVVTSHVAVPSQKDIEEALLRRKKQELLEKYGCMDIKLEQS